VKLTNQPPCGVNKNNEWGFTSIFSLPIGCGLFISAKEQLLNVLFYTDVKVEITQTQWETTLD